MNIHPPKWIDRFLQWYCNPDVLEEIQGDAFELYYERLKKSGKRSADRHYLWDVLRFFRWSNIRRDHEYLPGSTRALWTMNFKMAARQAGKNKLIFGVKTMGLSLCLAFALLLTAFVVNELTFDKFHTNHERIYRITSKIQFSDHVNNYAVTPLPLGQALTDDIPEIQNYFRLKDESASLYRIDERVFNNQVTLSADSNFLHALTYEFIEGNNDALNEPDKIVLTQSLAKKFFGDQEALGQTIEYGRGFLVEVAGIIRDVPENSHLQFDALISWDTFNFNDEWSNLNSYTYILIKPGASIESIHDKTEDVLAVYNDLIVGEYQATFEPQFENITDIHFNAPLEEDIARKGAKNNLYILFTVIVLFLVTGIINYLNLTLAELTANLKKTGVIRVFGGLADGHTRFLFAETFFTLITVIPLVAVFGSLGWMLAAANLGININAMVLTDPLFFLLALGFLIILFISTRINAYVLSKTSRVILALKGKLNSAQSGIPIRRILVGAQLSFSIIMIALVIIIVDQFRFIQEADKGFDDTNTLIVKVGAQYNAQKPFIETVRNLSGVARVDASSYYAGGLMEKYVFQVETETGMKELLVPLMHCGPDYMNALNIRIVQGHGFEKTGNGQYAYIINETAAQSFGWKDPIGKAIWGPVHETRGVDETGEVIGVVRDFAFASMHKKIEPVIMMLASPGWGTQYIYIKTNALHQPGLVSSIEKAFKATWPESPFEWEYLDTKYMSLYAEDYKIKNIFQIGLVISVLVSCLGIFSISALLVTLRTKEMGIRKVVGASCVQLFLLHTNSFTKFLVISILISWPAIWYLSGKWLQNFAYHIELNGWYFIIPGIAVLFITLLTAGYHGVKSAMINPVDTLRGE